MNKKTKYLFFILTITLLSILLETIYLQTNNTISKKEKEEKNILVSITQMPDLAISNEAMYIRYRSLSDTFSLFKDSPELREYFPTTFTYSHSHILNNTPSKVLDEQ